LLKKPAVVRQAAIRKLQKIKQLQRCVNVKSGVRQGVLILAYPENKISYLNKKLDRCLQIEYVILQ